MRKENTRRLIRNLAVIGGIVIAVILVFLLIRAIFFAPAATQTQLTDPLLDTSTDRGVSMVIRGPIVGSESARSVEIDVTPSSRSVTLFSGYDGTVVDKQVYSNSTAAYEQFVYALNRGGMSQSRTSSDSETRGICATGRLYTFSLSTDTTTNSSLWATTCNDAEGTLNANKLTLRNLFDAQIPDVDGYVRATGIN